ncbi:flagellar biosynthetic protein FliR [Buchnera aphidicola]|uniref:flagellar biosynthetic protein FliR n=1 Tax=Buchnera aphidicola TaxID=9 RepID=UPI0034642EAB
MINLQNFISLTNAVFFPAIRIFFILFTSSFLSNYLNVYIQVILSILFSYVIFENFPNLIDCSIFSFDGFIIFLQQIIIGMFIGFCINLIFSIVNVAGEILGLQTGLSFFNFFDSTNRTNFPVISRFLNILFIFSFLLINGHLWIITIIVKSFDIIPISIKYFHFHVLYLLVQLFGLVFMCGLQIIFPFILILLSINLTLFFVNKFFPQLSIFSISFPIISIVGILLLYVFAYYFISYLRIYFDEMFFIIIDLLSNM